MNDRFDVGEVAIIQHCGPPADYLNGQECAVIGGLMERSAWLMGSGEPWLGSAYLVDVDGHTHVLEPHQLRKKRPPEKTTTWDRCVWRPEKVTA